MDLGRVLSLLAGLAIALPATARDGDSVPVQMGNDLFFAGEDIRFERDVPGNALLTGGRIVLNSTVAGDAVVAGGRVNIRGKVSEDLYAAAGELVVEAQVLGSGRLAGGKVEVTDSARIAQGLSIGGGEIEVNGEVGQYVQIGGGSVRINGRVDGDVNVGGGELKVGPAAVITGTLTFRGPQSAQISEGAQVGSIRNITRESMTHGPRRFFGTMALVWAVGWIIAGIALIAMAPEGTRRVTDTMRAHPWKSALLGLVLLIVVPVAIVLLAITLLGIPLALLLVLAYFMLLPLGYLGSVAAISDALLERLRRGKSYSRGMRIAAFIVILALVALLVQVPVVGVPLSLLLILFGMGAVILALTRSREAAHAS